MNAGQQYNLEAMVLGLTWSNPNPHAGGALYERGGAATRGLAQEIPLQLDLDSI